MLTFALGLQKPLDAVVREQALPPELKALSPLQLGLINDALMLVVYATMGTVGHALARALGLPPIHQPESGWRR